MKSFIFIFSFFIISSCGQDITNGLLSSSSSLTSSSSSSALKCSCNNVSDPVCGYLAGNYVTFLNACLAQCAGYSFTSGKCTKESCDYESGQVCGVLNSGLNNRIYENECDLIRSGAKQVANSQCGF